MRSSDLPLEEEVTMARPYCDVMGRIIMLFVPVPFLDFRVPHEFSFFKGYALNVETRS